MTTELVKELTSEELDAVVREVLGTRLLSAQRMTGGLFNTTYLADTEAYGRTVLRLGPVNRHLLLPYENRLMEAEVEVYRLCAARGIPASEVLAADFSKTLVDRDIMFVKYLHARPMSEVELTPQDRASVLAALGKAMADYNGITGPRFGRIADVMDGGGFECWSGALSKELDEWESVCRPGGLFTEEEHRAIRSRFDALRPVLDGIRVPHLLHNDLWTGNVLVREKAAGGWEFEAIIDADRAIWGDPEMEVFWLGRDAQPFWDAYGRTPDQSPEAAIRRTVYRLFVSLWAAYIYGVEYDEVKTAAREADAARACLEELDGKTEG